MMFSVKSLLPRGLYARSLIILVLPVLLIQVVTTFVFFDNHWSRMTARLGFAVAGEVALLADLAQQGRLDSDAAAQYLDLDVRIEAGQVLEGFKEVEASRIWEYAVARKLKKELIEQLYVPFHLDVDFTQKLIMIDVQLEDGVMHVSLPQRRLFSSSGYIVILWMFGVSVLLLLVAVLFMRNQIRPIRKLAFAAERFGKGGDVHSFKPTGAREIRQAAQSFINMRDRIRRQIEQRTVMLAGVSHDLRTPLTRMKLQLEMMKESEDVRAMKSDLRDMERMIDGYLDFARGAGQEQASFTNLSALVRDVVGGFQTDESVVSCDVEDGVYLMLKPMATERCVSNVLKNALAYGERAWVSLSKDESAYVLLIEDNGPGIPELHREDVFKPFYRTDEARDTEDGHVGLGLSIVQDIVHSHGGSVALDRSVHGGLQVRITLPL